jgi:hypothetical protein
MNMMTSFLGIPVDGDIIRPERRKAQRPQAELTPLIQKVLNDPLVECFGWRQYTPYFNDGDPCVFSAHGLWARPSRRVGRIEGVGTVEMTGPLAGEDEDEWDENRDDYEVADGSTWGAYANRWEMTGDYAGPSETAYLRLRTLGDAIDGGTFDEVLLDAFGDHADIKVTRTKIHVDEYTHD